MSKSIHPRGHFAKKAGVQPGQDLRLVSVSEEVWEAFGGDRKAIERALRDVARIVARVKEGRKS